MKVILVVDDEERVRALLREYLSREGFQVLTAGDGREALDVARRNRPDLIILDVMMPVMDGYEFLRRYRDGARATTPVIMLTARVEDADAVLGLEAGADEYVTKPFSPRVLVARVRAMLRRSGMEPPGPRCCAPRTSCWIAAPARWWSGSARWTSPRRSSTSSRR